jgi:hypothetical protein
MFSFKASKSLENCKVLQQQLINDKLDFFDCFFLPAAGPRAFVSSGFEASLASSYLSNNIKSEKWLIGGSTGGLRALAFVNSLLLKQDLACKIKDHYCEMYYKHGFTSDKLHAMMLEMFDSVCPNDVLKEALEHDTFKVAILVSELRYPFSLLPVILLRPFLAIVVLLHLVLPSLIETLFFKRLCFYSGHSPPSFLGLEDSVEFCKLTINNCQQVLHATTSMPLISKTCTFIKGKGPGVYFDGGITDYYLNMKINGANGLLLGDLHPTSPIYRSALDLFVPWRRHLPDEYFEHVSVIRPTENFLKSLEPRSLPSVRDWFSKEYIKYPEKRKDSWNLVYDLSQKHWFEDSFADLNCAI